MSMWSRLRWGLGTDICWNQIAGPSPAGSTMGSAAPAGSASSEYASTAFQNDRTVGMSMASIAISSACTDRESRLPASASVARPISPLHP